MSAGGRTKSAGLMMGGWAVRILSVLHVQGDDS